MPMHPLAQSSSSVVSPKPTLPPSGQIIQRTTRDLEHQASISHGSRAHQTQLQPPGETMSNTRVASWAANVPAHAGVGPSPTPPPPGQGRYPQQQQHQQYASPPQQQMQYQYQSPPQYSRPPPMPPANATANYTYTSPPAAGPGRHQGHTGGYASSSGPPVLPRVNISGGLSSTNNNGSSIPSPLGAHPPRASSMYSLSTSPAPMAPAGHSGTGRQQSALGPAYDPLQYDRRQLHHSFSDLSLSSNAYQQPSSQGNPLAASTSRLQQQPAQQSGSLGLPDQQQQRYRTTSAAPAPQQHILQQSTALRPGSSSNLSASTSRPASVAAVDPNVALSSTLNGGIAAASSSSQPTTTSQAQALCIALPSQSELAAQKDAASIVPNPSAARVSWAKNVLKFVERHQACSAGGEYSKITDPTLVKWTDEAIRLILSTADTTAGTSSSSTSTSSAASSAGVQVPEALYLRGELSSSGKFPSYRSKDLSMAFRDFEAAANMGHYAAWAKIALAYETYGEQNGSQADFDRAKRAYEEGVQKNEVTCTYRIAMAHLLGQLGFQASASTALPLLRKAASYSTVDDPLPAYIYGMLLAGELDLGAGVTGSITPNLLLDERGRTQDARPWIERSAYLGYAPAQFKMGFNYEYATMGAGYDPLLSVQYYSLASQQGDIEADMALSKWFLCGSEAFDLQENLAFTFAEKAAKRGLPSAEFALGYYYEIGIGGRKDIELSKRWYSKAANHGNKDAADRLASLNTNSSNVLSRTEHEAQMNDKIVRKRTQAKADADSRRRRDGSNSGGQSGSPPRTSALPVSVNASPKPSGVYASPSGPQAARPPRMSSTASVPALPGAYPSSNGGTPEPPPAGFAYPNEQQQAQQPFRPSIMPTTDSNMSLRRRDTMRQVEQAAQYGHRNSGLSAGSSPKVQQSSRMSGSSAGGPPPRKNSGGGLAPPSDASGPGHIRRYSLVDSGPIGPPAGSSGASITSSQSSTSGVQMVSKASEGPQTFEAMGLKTGKVKAEQECVIC